jgi:hypothetical protein
VLWEEEKGKIKTREEGAMQCGWGALSHQQLAVTVQPDFKFPKSGVGDGTQLAKT